MRQTDADWTAALISLENAGRSLGDVLDGAQRQQQAAQDRLEELMRTLDDVRAAAAVQAKRTERLWRGLLHLADRSVAIDRERLPEACAWVSSLFQELGYTVYGLCGTTIEDPSRYDIVGKSQAPHTRANEIVQVLAVGLLHEDGSVARLAKVVVAA